MIRCMPHHLMIIGAVTMGLFTISSASAQLNTIDSTRVLVKLAAAGSLLEGNVNRLLLINRLDVNYANPQWGFSNRTDYQYGSRNHALSENDVVTWNFLYYQPDKKLYPFLMTILETNYRRRISFRYQAGPGLTYAVIKRTSSLLKASLSLTYENTNYNGSKFEHSSDTSSHKISTFRITPRIFGVHHLWGNKCTLIYEWWLQQSLSNARNYRLMLEQGLEFPFIKRIDIKTTLRYTTENIRLKGLKPYDLFWVFGVVVKNY